MNAWPDASALTNGNGLYNSNLPDANANPSFLDAFATNDISLSQLQNAQLQQRLHNGGVRNASPAFQNQAYHVNPVIPSKRPRPSEDGMAASPRQPPGNLNLSRSQTPQQMGYAGYQTNQHAGQGLQAPTPYQHLQQGGSTNATPSPTMQNQQFRQPGAPQRMQTVSPNPTSFPQTQPGMGMSPPPGDTSRGNTPHNPNFPMGGSQLGGMNYMSGASMPQGYNQNFGMTPGMAAMGMQGGLQATPVALSQNLQQRQAEAQRQYQLRLQQQQQQLAAGNLAAHQRHQNGGMGAMLATPNQHPSMQTPTRPQQPSQSMSTSRQTYESFLKVVAGVMQQQGRQFDYNPVVCGRPVNLYSLYMNVMKQKGSKRVTQLNQWQGIAQILGYPPHQYPTAGQDIKHVYERNLAPYEAAYWQAQQKKAEAQQQQAQMAGISAMPSGQQMSPTRPMSAVGQDAQAQQQYMQQLQQRVQGAQPTQSTQMTPVHSNAAIPMSNGWATSQTDENQIRQQNAMNHVRTKSNSLSRQLESTPPSAQQPGVPSVSPTAADKPSEDLPEPQTAWTNGIAGPGTKLIEGPNYPPRTRALMDTHGGIDVGSHGNIGAEVVKLKPNVPNVDEMGVIDIRTLGLSVQSGIHAEVRYALDHLVKLSHDVRLTLELERCEDLLDILVDCAEEQVDALAEDAAEVSDAIDLNSYEDVIRHCRVELEALQDIPEFGSLAYELDRAADRLIAITTILRNLSSFEMNHKLLSSPPVIKLFSNTVRLIGTRNMFLRSHRNTQDFMKDLITFLSNTTDKIELPSREDALNILHFLLAFAPSPPPDPAHPPLRFAPFNPTIHRYLPPAVDSLAKLLARDDPNRAFYKHIFAAEASSASSSSSSSSAGATNTPPGPHHHALLTRAFGLAISVVPDRARRDMPQPAELRIAETRKPYLTQAMLAADILASLCPGPEAGVARAWLEAEDGWAPSLLRLASLLSVDRAAQPQAPGQPRRVVDHEGQGFGLVTHRALGMLGRLVVKSRGGEADRDGGGEGRVARAQVDGVGDDRVDDVGRDGDVEEEGEVEDEEVVDRWKGLMADVLPKREMLLGALLTANIDAVALKQLCAFAGLEE